KSIRGSRPEPGLRPQHLAAVDLVAAYCDADVDGAELASETVTFDPGETRLRTLTVSIPTAGSVTLLLDTVLALATVADEPIIVTATGGTDVKWSPTVAYLRRVKLPLLARFGLDASLLLGRTGFYPAGGGEVTLRLRPSSLSRIDLPDRGALDRVEIYSKASTDLAERDVAERQADHARERLRAADIRATGIETTDPTVEYVETRSTGSTLLLRGVYERSLAGFDALGERGRTAEAVADRAVEAFTGFHDGAAAVEEHMADQLLLFLALAGGRVRIARVTEHVETTLSLLEAFGVDVTLDVHEDETATVSASPIDTA
ncbi:MAG: RNA 3'-terminal phosphate cyclase, partial [Halapricum sp.]